MPHAVRIGNSYGVILPKAILQILGIEGDKTKLTFETDGQSLTIRPVKTAKTTKRDKMITKAINATFKRYHKTFEILADK
jgi:antitoxin component of MazEF toxin-antitoxin module